MNPDIINDYWTAYKLAIRMMQSPEESPYRDDWHKIAARALLMSSNPRNLTVTYPLSLAPKRAAA